MQDRASTVRHAVLGAANALTLGTRALQLTLTVYEQVEFLDDIILASDELVQLLDEYEAVSAVTAKQ